MHKTSSSAKKEVRSWAFAKPGTWGMYAHTYTHAPMLHTHTSINSHNNKYANYTDIWSSSQAHSQLRPTFVLWRVSFKIWGLSDFIPRKRWLTIRLLATMFLGRRERARWDGGAAHHRLFLVPLCNCLCIRMFVHVYTCACDTACMCATCLEFNVRSNMLGQCDVFS